eukprot:459760_1
MSNMFNLLKFALLLVATLFSAQAQNNTNSTDSSEFGLWRTYYSTEAITDKPKRSFGIISFTTGNESLAIRLKVRNDNVYFRSIYVRIHGHTQWGEGIDPGGLWHVQSVKFKLIANTHYEFRVTVDEPPKDKVSFRALFEIDPEEILSQLRMDFQRIQASLNQSLAEIKTLKRDKSRLYELLSGLSETRDHSMSFPLKECLARQEQLKRERTETGFQVEELGRRIRLGVISRMTRRNQMNSRHAIPG